jgi:hypothetical protein
LAREIVEKNNRCFASEIPFINENKIKPGVAVLIKNFYD